MAGIITYLYDPAQVVWVIDECGQSGALTVLEGTILRVNATVVETATKLWYDIQLTEDFRNIYNESDVFPDLNSAIVEYQNRLSAA